MINAIAIDDEPPALEIIQEFCSNTDMIFQPLLEFSLQQRNKGIYLIEVVVDGEEGGEGMKLFEL
jgi:hypothetical protein